MNVCFSYAVGNHHSLSLKKNIVWLNSVCEPTKRKQKVLDAYIEVWVILRGKRSLLSMVPLVGDIHMIGKLSNFQSLTDISVIWQLRIFSISCLVGGFSEKSIAVDAAVHQQRWLAGGSLKAFHLILKQPLNE